MRHHDDSSIVIVALFRFSVSQGVSRVYTLYNNPQVVRIEMRI